MATAPDHSSTDQPPSLRAAKYYYIFKDILKVDPKRHWEFCQRIQTKWEQEFSKDDVLAERMVFYRKVSALTLVWVTDNLGGKMPDDVSQKETYRLLSELYDHDDDSESSLATAPASPSLDLPVSSDFETNAEKDRASQLQLKQHFFALKRLLKAAYNKEDLSEELIKSVHRDLMRGLKTEKGELINAGEYRSGPVSAGYHSFPDHKYIPESITSIVEKYNCKLKSKHDMFELASWLLFRTVSLHPFEDGNGRLCRLLWCYSLTRDGLPFPLTLNDGHNKAHDHYVQCIIKDRRDISCSDYPCLTALTVVSIKEKWDNFISNLSFEYPKGYEVITQWLKECKFTDL